MESGHLEVALINVGEVLIHSPVDSDGLPSLRDASSRMMLNPSLKLSTNVRRHEIYFPVVSVFANMTNGV